ncbi:MAG: GNAT family N-acetyltransferase [Candidatus Eremiobacteraeota bacterium]|nr:GNAT family N-acetyltransferase [Candidatus Eremiobacteraeota bacterium]
MSNEITIREALMSDLDALLPLVDAYRAFYKQESDLESTRSFMRNRLQSPMTNVFLAEGKFGIVGFAQVFETYSTVRLAPMFILEDLFVDPQQRGAGVGTALLQRVVEFAKKRGAGGMFLETAHDNETAQRVYDRAGWTRETEFYKYNAPL